MKTYSSRRKKPTYREKPAYRENNRDSFRDRPEMHKAVCDDCGKNCQVPFKPSNNKPIYCSNCFEKYDNSNRNSGRGSGRNSGRDSRREKEMFDVVCTSCGKDCQVPFKPTGSKPVLCSNCFANKPGKSDEKYDEINIKLDKILNILQRLEANNEQKTVKEKSAKKTEKEKKTEKVLKEIIKKSPVKKASPKKTVKKVTKKAVKKAAKKVIKKTKAKKK